MITHRRLWRTFLWLGCTGFGGGLAALAQIHSVVVQKRNWLSEAEYWEAAAIGQGLPGSPSANAIAYIGLRLRGFTGALVSYFAFILPSFLLMLLFAFGYRALQQLPNTDRVFAGLNAAVVGLVFSVCVKLGRRALNEKWHWGVAVLACAALLFRSVSVVDAVLFAGLLGIFIDSARRYGSPSATASAAPERPPRQLDLSNSPDLPVPDEIKESDEGRDRVKLLQVAPLLFVSIGTLPILIQLALLFLRVGAVTFGGGFVMIPLIEQEVVYTNGWLNHQQFADGMALGQIMPGPVIITAAFVGYYVAGIAGAIVATICAFLPSFLMVAVAGNYLQRLRSTPQLAAFLQGVLPAVVGMIAVAIVTLARSGIHSWAGALIAAASAAVLMRWRISPILVLLAAALLGLALQFFFPNALR